MVTKNHQYIIKKRTGVRALWTWKHSWWLVAKSFGGSHRITISFLRTVWVCVCVCVCFFLELIRGCLVCDFEQPFSVFKQHFTYLNALFHPHVFLKIFSNNNFQFLNTCTKRALTSLFCFVSFYETYTLFKKKKKIAFEVEIKNGVTLMSYKMTQFMSRLAHVTSCGGSMWGHSFITYNLSYQLYHFMRYKLCHFIRQQHMKFFFFLLQSIGL